MSRSGFALKRTNDQRAKLLLPALLLAAQMVNCMRDLRRTFRPLHVRAEARAAERSQWRLGLWASGGLLALALLAGRADASMALCASGSCSSATTQDPSDRYLRLSTALPGMHSASGSRQNELSDQELSSFSGVGMIVCTVDGETRSSTAFLVGAFDIAVTVAHTFKTESDKPASCVYNSTDALGQIRERIPVAYIKSQWEADPSASGKLSKDLAVVRLTQPSRFARRTMPLGRFSGDAASVVMVGFKDMTYSDTFKQKKRGRVYGEALGSSEGSVGAFMHDMDSLHIAPGAPVIDERTGVIIGIHTRLGQRSNTMITMNDWLEATIRTELATASQETASRSN